jgi:hypothetical protein
MAVLLTMGSTTNALLKNTETIYDAETSPKFPSTLMGAPGSARPDARPK